MDDELEMKGYKKEGKRSLAYSWSSVLGVACVSVSSNVSLYNPSGVDVRAGVFCVLDFEVGLLRGGAGDSIFQSSEEQLSHNLAGGLASLLK